MAYQAWEIAHGYCEASKYNLVRLEGPLSKGRDAPKNTPTQRGKVGYCPCCVRATHVTLPGSYRLGPYDGLNHTGSHLWAEAGPWAPRRLAATDYVLRFNDRLPPPTGWDCAAKSLEFPAPEPLIRGGHRSAPWPIRTVEQERAQLSKKGKMDKNTDKDAPAETQDGPSSSCLGVAGLTVDGSLRLDSLLPKGGTSQHAPSSKGSDTAKPSGAPSKVGSPKGSPSDAFLGDHWRGPRRPRPRQAAPVLGQNRESPDAPSSWYSGWGDWGEWKE